MVKLVSGLRNFGVLMLLLPGSALTEDCFPKPDETKPQYMLGYGTYLYEEARKSSGASLKLDVPVWVEDYKRAWLTRTRPEAIKMTELGVVASEGDKFNGILMSIDSGKLSGMDKHRKFYCRAKLDIARIKPMTDKKLDNNAEYWIYLTKKRLVEEPVSNYPIYQSRVDEFLTGCIDLSVKFKLPDFARQCMETTKGWSESWVNDRSRPITGKSVQGRKQQIDDLLMKYQKHYFSPIRAG